MVQVTSQSWAGRLSISSAILPAQSSCRRAGDSPLLSDSLLHDGQLTEEGRDEGDELLAANQALQQGDGLGDIGAGFLQQVHGARHLGENQLQGDRTVGVAQDRLTRETEAEK